MNNPQPIFMPALVTARLEELDVTREHLLEVIHRMVAVRRSVTDNHPPGSAGWMAWSEGTARLREVLIPHGWERNEDSRISSVHKGQIRIAVCNTDDGTGIVNQVPMNRSRKGAGTDHIVSQNQGQLGDILERSLNVVQISPGAVGGVVYWYLCVYSEGDVVRAELSCPMECESGFFKSFRERIILVGSDEDSGPGVRRRPDSPEGDPGFEVLVSRKTA